MHAGGPGNSWNSFLHNRGRAVTANKLADLIPALKRDSLRQAGMAVVLTAAAIFIPSKPVQVAAAAAAVAFGLAARSSRRTCKDLIAFQAEHSLEIVAPYKLEPPTTRSRPML